MKKPARTVSAVAGVEIDFRVRPYPGIPFPPQPVHTGTQRIGLIACIMLIHRSPVSGLLYT